MYCTQEVEHTSSNIELLNTIQNNQKYVTYLANTCNNLNTLYLWGKIVAIVRNAHFMHDSLTNRVSYLIELKSG